MKELISKSTGELKSLLKSKAVSAREILDAHYQQIDVVEPKISAFTYLMHDAAYKQADAFDQKLHSGADLMPLAGIPVAVKDNICVADYPTTCGSKILDGFKPPYNATVINRLLESGAIIIGKTNMDEFAMGSSTENSAFKPTLNPWNTNMVPGGSSGGSAAAVASGCATIALGSDTGGSIRQPASFCGIVGMKPTYGLVSRFGLIAFASSLDQIGPFGRNVYDVALTLEVISGHDKYDSTSLPNNLSCLSHLSADITNLRIGIIEELLSTGADAGVENSLKEAVKTLSHMGATVETVSLPNSKHALAVYYLIATAEASANLARYDGVKYGFRQSEAKEVSSMYSLTREQGFGAEVKRRIMLGTYALSAGYYEAYYKKAQQVRRLIKEDFDRAFAKFDFLLCPTTPTSAFAIGSKTSDPLQMYLSDIATIPANLAGIPGISLPCGINNNGLPIGLQLLGPALSDAKLLTLAYAFEQNTEFHKMMSPFLSNAVLKG